LNPCLLITIYDHPDTIYGVVSALASLGLPCFIVDDGSGEPTRRALDRVRAAFDFVEVVTRERNGGRGAALKTGYRHVRALGYSHALQLDADDQHDPRAAPAFLEASRLHPDALVLGDPIFDETAPRSRLYGRRISRFWVWVDTWSFAIHDPLCGMRCMPLDATLRILDETECGNFMDFDPEITVRLVWAGVPVVNVPTRVRYFADGVSHFHAVRDNLRLSARHARLFFEMFAHAPALLRRTLGTSRAERS
jgi:glycosyltransferase involved in cell wall biosynthesis